MSVAKQVSQYFDSVFWAFWIDAFAEGAMTVHDKTSTRQPEQLNLTLKQPFGVVPGIIPWEAPALFFFGKAAAAALTTGNTMVIKNSEKAPLTVCNAVSPGKPANGPQSSVLVRLVKERPAFGQVF